jgi:hypothetical protein
MMTMNYFMLFVDTIIINKIYYGCFIICVDDKPQVRFVIFSTKDGCDKSKVRSALLNCAHHI